MKCADLGHLAAALEVHKRWVAALEEEFFCQVGKGGETGWWCESYMAAVAGCAVVEHGRRATLSHTYKHTPSPVVPPLLMFCYACATAGRCGEGERPASVASVRP